MQITNDAELNSQIYFQSYTE